MLNLVNKIVTVILTLIVMINYSNGDIRDENVLLDKKNFTTEKIETCEQFKEKYLQYLINNRQYFVDKSGNYYAIVYWLQGTTDDSYAPFKLYDLNVTSLGTFEGCKEDAISFKNDHKSLIFRLKELQFFKPVDRFIQPPELEDANKVENVKSCGEFDDKVVQESTTGFVIYKNKLTNGFTKSCLWKGCARYTYLYSSRPKPRSQNDLLLKPEPFGFYWNEKRDTTDNRKIVYKNYCDEGLLNFTTIQNGKTVDLYQKLSNFTFYNIESKTKKLHQIKPYLMKRLSSCKEFNQYLENHNNILDNYIYFSDIRDPEQLYYHAMKVNLYGPEDLREKPYLLIYQRINYRHEGFAPRRNPTPYLFVGCQVADGQNKNDRLRFQEDSNLSVQVALELKDLLFYDHNEMPLLQGSKEIEMEDIASGREVPPYGRLIKRVMEDTASGREARNHNVKVDSVMEDIASGREGSN